MLQRKRKRISKMKIFGEKDVLLMTELKIDTMSQNETTKLDIIVEVLGEREPEIRRLVILDDRLRMFADLTMKMVRAYLSSW